MKQTFVEGQISHNTYMHRAVTVVVRPLVNTGIHPNHITAVRLMAGLAAAASVAVGTLFWLYIGAGLFFLFMLLDRADGALARLSGKTSRFGHVFDTITDSVGDALIFAGLGIGLARADMGDWLITAGILAGLGVAASFYFVMAHDERDGKKLDMLSGWRGVDPDDVLIVVPLCILFDVSYYLLAVASVCAPLFGIYMAYRYYFAGHPVE